jgi:hypothetical protein
MKMTPLASKVAFVLNFIVILTFLTLLMFILVV